MSCGHSISGKLVHAQSRDSKTLEGIGSRMNQLVCNVSELWVRYLGGTILIESVPLIGCPVLVNPFKTPAVSCC